MFFPKGVRIGGEKLSECRLYDSYITFDLSLSPGRGCADASVVDAIAFEVLSKFPFELSPLIRPDQEGATKSADDLCVEPESYVVRVSTGQWTNFYPLSESIYCYYH